MALTSLFALIDDIATLLDDIAVMSKVAAKKTAGVLGDDLALNAQQVAGVAAKRELPVVFAVATGSFKNKLILVPSALLISAFAPQVVTPLLVLGGTFLCFEGAEKIYHHWLHPAQSREGYPPEVVLETVSPADILAVERDKIRGAIRTDFVLSAEIIVIALGTVATAPMSRQILVLASVAVLMTIGVYGLVAAIVKLDDLGFYFARSSSTGWGGQLARGVGRGLIAAAPRLMKGLSVAGTAAMFSVGGGILLHGFAVGRELGHQWAHILSAVPVAGPFLGGFGGILLDAFAGVLTGALVVAAVQCIKYLRR